MSQSASLITISPCLCVCEQEQRVVQCWSTLSLMISWWSWCLLRSLNLTGVKVLLHTWRRSDRFTLPHLLNFCCFLQLNHLLLFFFRRLWISLLKKIWKRGSPVGTLGNMWMKINIWDTRLILKINKGRIKPYLSDFTSVFYFMIILCGGFYINHLSDQSTA